MNKFETELKQEILLLVNAHIVKKSYGLQVIIVIIDLMRLIGEKFLKTGQLLSYQEKKMMFSVLQNLRIKYVLWENWMLKFIWQNLVKLLNCLNVCLMIRMVFSLV